MTVATLKQCWKCTKEKDRLLDFGRDASRVDGRSNVCKSCKSEQNKLNRRTPEQQAEAARKSRLKTRFGMTLEQYDQMLAAQGGVCALCEGVNSGGRPLSIDHCHETGRIRGLLCIRCNTALGVLGDNMEGLKRALNYLKDVTP